MNNQFTHPKERIRFAILTFFFAQGLCMASWASRIPDFKDVFAANYAFYWGLILFMIPVGKFVAIPLAGYLVSKLGSRSMVQVSILGYASSLLCIGLAHEVYLLGFLLFCFGVCWNLCDISFNTQGIEVERIYGKTIMGTTTINLPSKSVIVPVVVPTTFTEAPIIGSPVVSTTTPLNVCVFWAIAGKAIVKARNMPRHNLIILLCFIIIAL